MVIRQIDEDTRYTTRKRFWVQLNVQKKKKQTKKNIHDCQIWDERRTRLSTDIATSSCPTSDRPALQILKQELNKLIRKMTGGESDDILKSEVTQIFKLQNNRCLEYQVQSFQKTYSKPVGSSSYLAMFVPLTTKAKMEMEIILLH